MNLQKKIEEIRQMPEHIRLRYVWGCVAVSMVVVFAVWIFSITAMFRKNNPTETTLDTTAIQEQLQNIKEQSNSLKDYTNQPLTIDKEGVTKNSKDANTDFQYPATDDTSGAPEASTYSDLQNTQQ